MARLEHIKYQPHRAIVEADKVRWVPINNSRVIHKLPQLFWQNGTPWDEANHWALDKASSSDIKLSTVQSLMAHLRAYASWLESSETDWRHFPMRKQDRVLVLYRGNLIRDRDDGRLSPSTATARMRAIIQFYRHCGVYGFISKESPMWQDKMVIVRYFDSVGFERSLMRLSADLSIPNRARHGVTLEDGLLPVSAVHQRELLQFAADNASIELHLLLMSGFFTGARLGTLTTLHVSSLETAVPDTKVPSMWRVAVGPGTGVHTKFDVHGNLLIPAQLMQLLKQYAYGSRRLRREAKADGNNKVYLFLNRSGKRYPASAVTREMVEFRRSGARLGLKYLSDFHFHQTRATFGTWLMSIALDATTVKAALEFVRDAMMHKHESTTMRYIRFIEHTKAKIEVANAFTKAFAGLTKG